jgi:hypothetical protein
MIDWTTLLLGGLIGAIIGIPFGLFINLATPWVKSFLDKRKLSTNERKRFILLSHYRNMRIFRLNPHQFYLWLLRFLVVGFINLAMLITVVGMIILFWNPNESPTTNIFPPIVWGVLIFVLFASFCSIMALIADEITNVFRFDDYKTRTSAKLKKLGGNPIDLEKIDKAVDEWIEEQKQNK